MTLVPIQPPPSTHRVRHETSTLSSRTPRALRTVGYTLLLLSLLDWIVMLVPIQLMEPAWEFQTIGALVERLPVPLIGLALVFFGEAQQRYYWEFLLTRVLSWLSFLLGLLFFMMLPLGLINGNRLYQQSEMQRSNLYQQRLEQVETFEAQVGEVDDAAILRFLEQQGIAPEDITLDNVRVQATAELDKVRQQIYSQTEAEKIEQRRSLLENVIKWNLGAIIGGTAFLYLWRLSRWARSSRHHP